MRGSRKTRILIVDDEAGFTRLLRLNLERTGDYEVRAENMGSAALPAAREFHPDLILLDFVMPDLGGPEVAASLRADPDLRHCPIVFLTAAMSGEIRGEETILFKPVRFEELIACIEASLVGGKAG